MNEYIKDTKESVEDMEETIPTIDEIKSYTGIDVLSINKYFSSYYSIGKHIFISGAYIIFTELPDIHIGSSVNITELATK